MPRMQQPTCTGIRIRSTTDAHKIFYAVQKGSLKMVTRRLDSDERLALGSGCVYAWEERGPHTEITGLGIERFTEGRRWSPSRVRDEFLFYYEKYSPPESGGNEKLQAPRDWDPLVKQTYSVWVETEKGRRKWHLTAYFTQLTVDNLGTIDDVRNVGDLVVPEGMFKSTRVNKTRGKIDDSIRGDESTSRDVVPTTPRTYAAFPTPYPPSVPSQSTSVHSVPMYQPYPTTQHFSYPHSTPVSRHVPLPTRTPYQNGNRVVPLSDYSQQNALRYVASPRIIATPGPSYAVASPYATTPSDALYPPSSQPSQQPWYESPSPVYLPSEGYPSPRPEYSDQPIYPTPARPTDSSVYHQAQSHYNPMSTSLTLPSDPSSAQPPSLIPPQSQEAPLYPGVNYPSRTTYAHSTYSSDDGAASPSGSSTSGSGHSGEAGRQRDLAPLHSLKRHHPYRRDPEDDKALRLLNPRPSPPTP